MSEMLEKARKYENEQGMQIKAEDKIGRASCRERV